MAHREGLPSFVFSGFHLHSTPPLQPLQLYKTLDAGRLVGRRHSLRTGLNDEVPACTGRYPIKKTGSPLAPLRAPPVTLCLSLRPGSNIYHLHAFDRQCAPLPTRCRSARGGRRSRSRYPSPVPSQFFAIATHGAIAEETAPHDNSQDICERRYRLPK